MSTDLISRTELIEFIEKEISAKEVQQRNAMNSFPDHKNEFYVFYQEQIQFLFGVREIIRQFDKPGVGTKRKIKTR